MQMYHVGLLESLQAGDVGSGIGDVDLEQVLFPEAEMEKDAQPLPQEVPAVEPMAGKGSDMRVVGLSCAHQHLCLNAVAVQGLHEVVGSQGGTACPLARANNQYAYHNYNYRVVGAYARERSDISHAKVSKKSQYRIDLWNC